jgi:hypothetical protein
MYQDNLAAAHERIDYLEAEARRLNLELISLRVTEPPKKPPREPKFRNFLKRLWSKRTRRISPNRALVIILALYVIGIPSMACATSYWGSVEDEIRKTVCGMRGGQPVREVLKTKKDELVCLYHPATGSNHPPRVIKDPMK